MATPSDAIGKELLQQARAIMQQHSYDAGDWPTPSPSRERMLREISRSTEIVGRILDGIAHDHSGLRKPSSFLVGVARWLWSVVELATHNNFAGLLWRYWFAILLLAEGLLLLGSYLFARPEARALAWELLIVTLGYAAVVEWFRLWIGSSAWWRRILVALVALVVIAVLALTVVGADVAVTHYSLAIQILTSHWNAWPTVRWLIVGLFIILGGSAMLRTVNWKRLFFVFMLLVTISSLGFDLVAKEGMQDFSVSVSGTGSKKKVTGVVSYTGLKVDVRSRSATAIVKVDLEAPDSSMDFRTVSLSPAISDTATGNRAWLSTSLQDCGFTTGNELAANGERVSRATVECNEMPIGVVAERREIWYPFDSYHVALQPVACANSSLGFCDQQDPSNVEIRKINVSMANTSATQTFMADVVGDPSTGYSVVLRRRLFLRLVSVLLLVSALVFLIYSLVLGDARDLLSKSLGVFAGLWALRALIVPATIDLFPTVIDYFVLAIFCLLFWLIALKLEKGAVA